MNIAGHLYFALRYKYCSMCTVTIKKYFQTTLLAGCLLILLGACSSSRKNSSSATEPGSSLQKKYGKLLAVPAQNITNGDLYSFIDKWLNTAYKYGGQSSKGIDCSAFAQILYDQVFNKKLPRNSQAQYDAASTFTSRNKLHEGDLVFFTTLKGKKISHVGVYLQNNKFVNATNSGVAISNLTDQYWNDRFVAGGKLN